MSNRINNFFRSNNDIIRSKTSPIKKKTNKSMINSISEKRKNIIVKKTSLLNNKNSKENISVNKKRNDNYIYNLKYKNISNSHFGFFPNLYNKRMLKKKHFQLKGNNSTFENSSTSRMKNSLIEIYNPLKIISNRHKISNNNSLNELKLKPICKSKKKDY